MCICLVMGNVERFLKERDQFGVLVRELFFFKVELCVLSCSPFAEPYLEIILCIEVKFFKDRLVVAKNLRGFRRERENLAFRAPAVLRLCVSVCYKDFRSTLKKRETSVYLSSNSRISKDS